MNYNTNMRSAFMVAREKIVKGEGVTKTDADSVKKQLELLYDAMVDNHNAYTDTEECSDIYKDAVHYFRDPDYATKDETLGPPLMATIKKAYLDEKTGDLIVPMLSAVSVIDISFTGIVTFDYEVFNKKVRCKLYSDELGNYRWTKQK